VKDYFSEFIASALLWVVWGLLYFGGFRRSNNPYIQSISKYNGVAWLCITGWMIYELVMWLRFR